MLLEMGAQEAIYVDRAVISGVGCGRGRLLQCLAPRLRCTQPHGWPGPGSLRQHGNGEGPAVTSKEETLCRFLTENGRYGGAGLQRSQPWD